MENINNYEVKNIGIIRYTSIDEYFNSLEDECEKIKGAKIPSISDINELYKQNKLPKINTTKIGIKNELIREWTILNSHILDSQGLDHFTELLNKTSTTYWTSDVNKDNMCNTVILENGKLKNSNAHTLSCLCVGILLIPKNKTFIEWVKSTKKI